MTEYVIHIPNYSLPSLNKITNRSHWAVKRRIKDGVTQMVAAYITGIPKAEGRRQVQLCVTLGKGQRGLDDDNYRKMLLDSLVSLRLLKDDSRKWVEFPPVIFDRAQYPATTIKLIDIQECKSGFAKGYTPQHYTAKSRKKSSIGVEPV